MFRPCHLSLIPKRKANGLVEFSVGQRPTVKVG